MRRFTVAPARFDQAAAKQHRRFYPNAAAGSSARILGLGPSAVRGDRPVQQQASACPQAQCTATR
jgi:hypothetical protein